MGSDSRPTAARVRTVTDGERNRNEMSLVAVHVAHNSQLEQAIAMLIIAVDRPHVPPCPMPARFCTDVAYFMTPAGQDGAPRLPSGEYWIRSEDARRWLDEGVVEVVSPLDSYHSTEFEISDEQENWLRWLVEHQVQHIRLQP